VLAHEALFMEDRYPSATTCKACHASHYREWSVSQHAYAQISPVYMAMQRFTFARTSGTAGDFCIRCHNPVGMNIGEPIAMNNLERHPTSREGITCVACHRVERSYGKINGRLAMNEGPILDPVYGPTGNKELKRVLANRDVYRVVTEAGASGRQIHTDAKRFFQLTEPGFCAVCHDVTLPGGYRLEEAFSEFKTSPAARDPDDGMVATCQDCHMGTEQGVPSGYAWGPAAKVGGVETEPRKLTSHVFSGPDHSIVHPGVFPHSVDAARLATLEEWLALDHEAGWGTDAFEDAVPEGTEFPPRWASIDDRYDARKILDKQLELLEWARQKRLEVLRNGFEIGEVVVEKADREGIRIRVEVRNATFGHNVPTGFIAERPIWLRVAVYDEDGVDIFLSGDLDADGDLRDSHSQLVLSGDVPLDDQLFSLQSFFIIRNNRGGEREQVLGVNYSRDVMPFIRPATTSTILTGTPVGLRIHRRSIEPLGSRTTYYEVPGEDLIIYGPYRVEVELMAGMVPINLLHAIQDVGFDFNMSPREVGDRIVDGHEVLWTKVVEFEIE
jgi:nitrate/TMAO reductase-like tetraheme cytochrome c subunit